MSFKGTCADNSVAESFFSSLKRERTHGKRYRTREELRRVLFEYIEVLYNRRRRHSHLDGMSPGNVRGNGQMSLTVSPQKRGNSRRFSALETRSGALTLGPFLGLLVVAVAVLVSGCTKSIAIPPAGSASSKHSLMYRIYTTSGCTYYVTSFTSTDSTIVVSELKKAPANPSGEYCGVAPALPFELRLNEVQRMERIEEGIGFATAIVVITLTFVGLATATAVAVGN
jgi:hypothetical protein